MVSYPVHAGYKLTTILGMCGRAYSPRFLFMWPNAKISVMGPDQLSSVMQTVSGKRGAEKATEDEGEDRWRSLREKIEGQSTAYYSTARIWVSLCPSSSLQRLDWDWEWGGGTDVPRMTESSSLQIRAMYLV